MQDAPERYRDVLGDAGLAALDTILTRKLDEMPPDSRLALSHTGLTLRAMSESLARALGDIDRLVRELARDLETPARYVRIAHELDVGARREDALEWLQQGVAAHGAADDGLRDAIVAAYLRADRRKDAVALLRDELLGRRAHRSPRSCSARRVRSATASAPGHTPSSRRPRSETAMRASSSRRCSPTAQRPPR